MPPKKVPRIEKGQKTLFSFAAKEGSSSTSESIDTTAESPSSSSSEITDRSKVAASSSRAFRAVWIKEFQPWLQYDKEKGMLCIKNGRENSFTEGCTNYRHSAIIDHVRSKDHALARSVPNLVENNERCQEKMTSDEEKAALIAVKAVHWLVNEDLPLSKYPSFVKFLKDLGVPFADKLTS